ncbi:transposable element Tcb2 transposase [Trichonephila clavipes]|nr:transposable element Tcb2 transposase [Trichonephila clavipes]
MVDFEPSVRREDFAGHFSAAWINRVYREWKRHSNGEKKKRSVNSLFPVMKDLTPFRQKNKRKKSSSPESLQGRLEFGQTIEDTVGVARSVVARLWNRFQEQGNVRRQPGAGRPRATISTDDRYIQLTARRNRTENATQMQRQLLFATGRRVSSQTVRNRLHEGGLYERRPLVCIPLTTRHRAARRRLAAKHRDWEQHDWGHVLFTYESRLSLECDTRRVLVWRDRGTRNNPAFVRERSQYRRAGWMVWGGISIGGRTDLHFIRNGTLTGRRYADEILRPHVILYAEDIGDSFLFQDDNARPHRARLVENILEAETIQCME